MKYLLLLTSLLLTASCSSISDIARFNVAVANVAVRSGVVHHAIVHNSAHGGAASTSTGVAATGAAIALAINAPEIAKDGSAVPVSIVGLGLYTGESARIYADNCEVMEIINYGDTTLNSISTQIRMSGSGDGIIRVETAGREAKSQPVKIESGGVPCNTSVGFSSSQDIDFANYASRLSNNGQSIKLKGSQSDGASTLTASIEHPMNYTSPHYITNISVVNNEKEIIVIKGTPALSKNPKLELNFESYAKKEEIILYWRDSEDKVEKQIISI